jgi:hypothetical protein
MYVSVRRFLSGRALLGAAVKGAQDLRLAVLGFPLSYAAGGHSSAVREDAPGLRLAAGRSPPALRRLPVQERNSGMQQLAA